MNSITPIFSRKISEPTSDTQNFKKNKTFGITFKANKNQIIDEFSKTILKNIEQSSKTDASLKKIFADENKTKTFMGVLGGLITSVAVGITDLLHKENPQQESYIDIFSKEVKSEENQKTTQNKGKEQPSIPKETEKTSKKKQISTKELLKEFNCPRGKKPAVEKELLEIVENNSILTTEEKTLLIGLLNKFCGYNRDGYQVIARKKIPNLEIAKQLCEELKQNEFKNATEIFNKYRNNEFCSSKTSSTKHAKQKTQNKLVEIANKSEPIVAKKFIAQLETEFKGYEKELSELSETISEKEATEIIAYIANGTITKENLEAWRAKFKDSKISFSKFINFVNNGIEADSLQIEIINSMLQKNRVSDIDVTKQYGDHNIKLTFPLTNTIKDNFKTIADIFEIIKDERISIEPKFPIRADKESIVEELKIDYKNQNYKTSTYPNLIRFIYGSKHQICGISSFDAGITNQRIKDLTTLRAQTLSKILNNPRIFDPEIFDLHSAMRFLERFVFDGNIDYRQIESIVRQEVGNFNIALRNSMKNGIEVVTYEKNDKIAPQFKITNEIGDDVTITLDKGGRIHTIY